MKRNCQHDTLSIEDEISNEVDFENIVDGFPFIKARAHVFPSTSGSNMTYRGRPLGKAEGRL